MSFAAILGVKDEVELVGESIAHLRRIGVDEIAVSDFGSTDGTLDVLAAECRMGDVSLTHVDPDLVFDYESSSAHDIAQAQRTRADWLLFLDADEFFIPATGRLRDGRQLADADVLVVDRFNVVTTASHLLMPVDLSPAAYGSLCLFTRQVDDFRAFLDQRPDVPFIGVRPGPKILARREAARSVAPGAHDVVSGGLPVRRAAASDLIVAHVPFTTMARFERKVVNIRVEMTRHPRFFEGTFAWHWRRWAEMSPAALEREFARQLTEATRVPGLIEEGVVRSAEELFASRLPAPAAPRAGWTARWRRRLGLGHRAPALRRVDAAPVRHRVRV